LKITKAGVDFPLDPAFACAYSAAQQPSRVAMTTGSLIHDGALAQLGERLHGMQEVSGSIPLGSTITFNINELEKPLTGVPHK
jgi:hypothetical protein